MGRGGREREERWRSGKRCEREGDSGGGMREERKNELWRKN